VVIKNGRFAGNNVHLVPDQFGMIAEILIETHLPLFMIRDATRAIRAFVAELKPADVEGGVF